MFNLTFTPNPKFVENYRQAQTVANIAYLKALPDKTFDLTVGHCTYALRYVIDDQGKVDIYSTASTGAQSLTTPVLQLNIGQLLLPEYLDLPDPQNHQGFNPDVRQVVVREFGDAGLSTAEAQAVMAEIEKQGFLTIIRRKNRIW